MPGSGPGIEEKPSFADGRNGLARWRLAGVRGLAAIGLGAACFFVPETGLIRLERLFAAALLIDGVLAAATAPRTWPASVEAASDVAAALFVAGAPGVALDGAAIAASAAAILAGLARGAAGIRGGNRGLLAAAALSIVWGVLTPLRSAEGVAVWAAWFGVYAVLLGAMMLALAFDSAPAPLGGLTGAAPGVSVHRLSR